MHVILPNISKSKGNRTMKFGELIECNMRNIFLEKSYTKCVGETSARPFSKKSRLSIPLDQHSKILYSMILQRKYFLRYILLTDQISLYDCMCIAVNCFPLYDVIKFEINLSFLTKPFFPMAKKVRIIVWISQD